MSQSQTICGRGRIAASIIMITALAWLTISLPFVNATQRSVKQQTEKNQPPSTAAADSDDAFSNTAEEKTESNNNILSEYLHDVHLMDQHGTNITTYYKCHVADVYYAFHPEFISPPPKV